MATMLALANHASPITGITASALAWQITAASAPDLVTCLAVIGAAGYDGWVKTKSDPHNPLTTPVVWKLAIMSGEYLIAQNIVVTLDALVNDWVFFDGTRVWIEDITGAATNYTMTEWVGP